MANYKCEDLSSCTHFQLAICLHCNRRLRLLHITEHNNILHSTITDLSNEVETIFQQINEESNKRRNIYNNILTSLDQWRIEQIENIEHICKNQLKLIEAQRETLNNAQDKLLEQLERNARQPLEHLQKKPQVNMEIIDHIRQTIVNIQEDSEDIKWNLPTLLPPMNTEYSFLNLLSIPIADENKPIPKQSVTIEMTSSRLPSTTAREQNTYHPLEELVQMFANISCIGQNRINIAVYIENGRHYDQLPILICSYLTAWHRKSNTDEKVFLLNEHISTIQKYLPLNTDDINILIGLQAFFFHANIQENKSEMMTFLLQFFLHHQCINQTQIRKWYDIDSYVCHGFERIKELATPFIQSLSLFNTTQIKIEDVYSLNYSTNI